MATTTGQGILALIESDVLQVAGPAILNYLTNVKSAGGDAVKQTAYWIQFQGEMIAALPQIESNLLGSIITSLQTKLTSVLAGPPATGSAHTGGPQ